jgi:Fe-S-cluster containining protein
MKFFEALSKVKGEEVTWEKIDSMHLKQTTKKIDGVTFLYPEGIYFECENCGNCCSSDVPLSRKEVDSGKFETKRGSEHSFSCTNLFVKKKEENKCIYLENNKCKVYEDRPVKCRTFPWIQSPAHLLFAGGQLVHILYVEKEESKSCHGFHLGEMTDENLRRFIGPLTEFPGIPEKDAMESTDVKKLLNQALIDAGIKARIELVKE